MNGQPKQVSKRRVFHIPGYDPMHPRRYRELYRNEGAAQAKISGYEIGVKADTGRYFSVDGGGPDRWACCGVASRCADMVRHRA